MATLLAVQLLISFFVGGSLITVLSLLAERARERVAGIILMFPSTVVLGFFFLGITSSAEKVAQVIPFTFIPLGIVILSSVIYIYFAMLYERITSSRLLQIILSFVSASVVWFLLVLSLASYKISNLWLGLGGYLCLAALAHVLLKRKSPRETPPPMKYNARQLLFRAAFIGTIIMLVVLAGKVLGLFWGGLFTMYPAATFSSLVILNYYYPPAVLFGFFRRAPLGSLSVAVYNLSAMLLFPIVGVVSGTALGWIICIVFSFTIIKLQHVRIWK